MADIDKRDACVYTIEAPARHSVVSSSRRRPRRDADLGAPCVNTRLHSKKVFFFTGRFKVHCSV